MLQEDKTQVRIDRHSITQEDFTPQSVVDLMLSQLPEDLYSDFSKSVIDPSCGIGNFLVTVLEKRLEHCNSASDVFSAIESMYGIELMADNVEVCRTRLYDLIVDRFSDISSELDLVIRATIRNRIQWYDTFEFFKEYRDWPALQKEQVDFKEQEKECYPKYPMWTDPREYYVDLRLF